MKTGQRVVIESDKKCPNCGKVMLVKTSRFGTQFLGCSGYPECKTIISLNNSVELDSVDGENKEAVVDEKCEKDQNCQGVDYNYIYYRIFSFDAKFIIN